MQGINWGLSWNSNWKLWTRVWGSPFLRDLCPISLHDIHYSYLSYCGRATSCTQVSFNSRPELIIESYELYISTSEPTSARNSNIDPLQFVIGTVRNRHDGEQGCFRLQKYAGKNTWRLFKKFHWKISRSNGVSEKVFLFGVTIQMNPRCLYFHVVLIVSKHFKNGNL